MRAFIVDCQKSGDLLEHRVSPTSGASIGRSRLVTHPIFGRLRLACLLSPVMLLLAVAVAVAVADPFQIVPTTKTPTPESKPDTTKESGVLVPATKKPAGYEKFIADSPYPKTDSPETLTLEQLEAIAKLPPKSNETGLQTHPAMLPLFRDMVLRYTGGNYKNTPIHFRLHTPEKYEKGKKYPLVVWLHGIGECGPDNIDQLSHLHHIIPSLVGPKKRDFFLLVSQCPHSHRQWEAPERCSTTVRPDGSVECKLTDDPVALGNAPISFTLAMVEAVIKDHPVDANRVTVAGLSSGGRGVWKILERRPDLFAAAVPLVSWKAIGKKSLLEKPLLKKIPIWAIYSSDDSGIDRARKEFELMKENGCRVFKTEFGVCGHRAWTPAMLQGDIFGWLVSRAKDGDRYYAAEPSPTGPEEIGIFADVTEGHLVQKPTPATIKTKKAKESDGQSSPIAARNQRVKEKVKKATKTITDNDPKARTRVRPPTVPPYVVGAPSTLIDQVRLELVSRYLDVGEVEKALGVADKMKSNYQKLFQVLLRVKNDEIQLQLLDYVDRKIDQMEQHGIPLFRHRPVFVEPGGVRVPHRVGQPARSRKVPKKETLKPIPAGKKNPMDECGKEWNMTTTTQYGLFPSGWDKEANDVPAYVFNETGKQLYVRLANAFQKNDLVTMKELCESFIKLDDVPLSSPWFDVSGGRLKGRIKYTLNEKAKPVVRLLRDIAHIKAESKKEFIEFAKKALQRIEKITNPKVE
jgi:predicted esterase